MKATPVHIQLNVSDVSFYKELLAYFEYQIIEESEQHIGATNGTLDFWVLWVERNYKQHPFHRKAIGLNHIAFQVEKRTDVDAFVGQFLARKKIEPLYGGAKEYPEYAPGYYAVYFEDPDRLKLEVMTRHP